MQRAAVDGRREALVRPSPTLELNISQQAGHQVVDAALDDWRHRLILERDAHVERGAIEHAFDRLLQLLLRQRLQMLEQAPHAELDHLTGASLHTLVDRRLHSLQILRGTGGLPGQEAGQLVQHPAELKPHSAVRRQRRPPAGCQRSVLACAQAVHEDDESHGEEREQALPAVCGAALPLGQRRDATGRAHPARLHRLVLFYTQGLAER